MHIVKVGLFILESPLLMAEAIMDRSRKYVEAYIETHILKRKKQREAEEVPRTVLVQPTRRRSLSIRKNLS